MCRSDAILQAVRTQLQQRKLLVDAAEDLGEIKITIMLQAGTERIRKVRWEEEREIRSQIGITRT